MCDLRGAQRGGLCRGQGNNLVGTQPLGNLACTQRRDTGSRQCGNVPGFHHRDLQRSQTCSDLRGGQATHLCCGQRNDLVGGDAQTDLLRRQGSNLAGL